MNIMTTSIQHPILTHGYKLYEHDDGFLHDDYGNRFFLALNRWLYREEKPGVWYAMRPSTQPQVQQQKKISPIRFNGEVSF